MKEFLAKRWFLLSLVVVFTLGLSFHEQCASWAKQTQFQYAVVFTVLFLMAVSLSLKALRYSPPPWDAAGRRHELWCVATDLVGGDMFDWES